MGLNQEPSTTDIFGEEKRAFYLSDDIDSKTVTAIIEGIHSINKKDNKEEKELKNYTRKPIRIYINSFGGSVYDMWGLIDTMLNSKTDIYTYCTGYAMSAGFKIFLAGKKRFANRHSTFMYHQLSYGIKGKIQDIADDLEESEYIQSEIEEYVVSRTMITKEKLGEVRKLKKDWYIHYPDFEKYGIVTKE